MIFACDPVSFQRTASGAPVFPLAGFAVFFVIGSYVSDACSVFPDNFQWVLCVNVGNRAVHLHLAFGDVSVGIKNHVAVSHAARSQVGDGEVGSVCQRGEQTAPGEIRFDDVVCGEHSGDDLLLFQFQIIVLLGEIVLAVKIDTEGQVSLQNPLHQLRQPFNISAAHGD